MTLFEKVTLWPLAVFMILFGIFPTAAGELLQHRVGGDHDRLRWESELALDRRVVGMDLHRALRDRLASSIQLHGA